MVAQTRGGTPTKALDVAERLMQIRGYNGFSFADIAGALRLTKASLHYHFATKGDLGRAVMRRYTEGFLAALAKLDIEDGAEQCKLDGYVAIYASVLSSKRMCLCGMLAAEYATLPKAVRAEVLKFFDLNETWLTTVLESGLKRGTFHFVGDASDVARLLIAGLEGAMLLARSYDEPERFELAAKRLMSSSLDTDRTN